MLPKFHLPHSLFTYLHLDSSNPPRALPELSRFLVPRSNLRVFPDGAPHVLRVRRADRRPVPAGGGRRRVAHGLPALLRVRRATRPPPLLLPARQTGLLQAGLCQSSIPRVIRYPAELRRYGRARRVLAREDSGTRSGCRWYAWRQATPDPRCVAMILHYQRCSLSISSQRKSNMSRDGGFGSCTIIFGEKKSVCV
ncbi:unnamed protein product [Colias eurytheme]|nr:unnamed protein product [Colias eurytheme]